MRTSTSRHRQPKVPYKSFRPYRRGYAAQILSATTREHQVQLAGNRITAACAAGRMEPAEVARTITSLVTYGTLSSVGSDGTPLGTFVTFVLDDAGCPLLRLRADAAHTANLQQTKKCTLFAHASEKPARDLARVTLVGEVEDISEDEAAEAAARHSAIYGAAIGVDAPQPDDVFKRLRVAECFYVAGLGEPTAETISGEDYSAAEADALKDDAARIVALYNSERVADVMRIAAKHMDVSFDEILSAKMLWVDTHGVDFHGQTLSGKSVTGRFSFSREALDDLDVLSLITMAAQEAWEAERSYTPTMPELAGNISDA